MLSALMETNIIPFETGYTDQILHIWNSAASVAHDFLPTSYMIQEAMNIKEIYLPNASTWMYMLDGKIVGFISMMGHEIGGLFVHPTYQQLNIGSTLLSFVCQQHEVLQVKVYESNQIGRNFYRKHGFEIIDKFFHIESQAYMLELQKLPIKPSCLI